jgi:hypothetical protein
MHVLYAVNCTLFCMPSSYYCYIYVFEYIPFNFFYAANCDAVLRSTTYLLQYTLRFSRHPYFLTLQYDLIVQNTHNEEEKWFLRTVHSTLILPKIISYFDCSMLFTVSFRLPRYPITTATG